LTASLERARSRPPRFYRTDLRVLAKTAVALVAVP